MGSSPFAAPILFTPKKDGGCRMCTDYRALNRVTIKSRYPIPRGDEVIDQFPKALFFSNIDLRGGYHQIRVVAADCHKTAFRASGPVQIETVQAKLPPKNLEEMQSFLGFVNYVLRFILNMAGVIAPLTDLLRKGTKYKWGEKEQATFSALKTFLCSTPILRIDDPHRPFKVTTDASDIAIGAILLQDFGEGLQPIAYKSRKLHSPERNYPKHVKEMLAIVHAFKVWRCYPTGADVTVWTNHRSLQYIRAQPLLNP
ncbi:hypothetical protein CLOM_g10364 [Closterium sp. NIES-68]|nr:hypothetical protein CLOM_g10364 [Closterium sp. NIES-68]